VVWEKTLEWTCKEKEKRNMSFLQDSVQRIMELVLLGGARV
jgi:hypothetical protein